MKKLEDHTIIYDDECPLCDAYTGAFVRTGMIGSDGRTAYTQASESLMTSVDKPRSRDEIALVNTKTGKVTYGIDSITTILGNSFPWMQPLFSMPLFKLVMSRVYAFISYNRKVIVPGKVFEGENRCTPSFSIRYRVAYIVFAWIITAAILHAFGAQLVPLVPAGNLRRELIMCGGQLLFQGVIVYFHRKDRLVHYLGNLMTVSLMGSLMLLPLMLLPAALSPFFFVVAFAIVVMIMLAEHARRTRILGLHWGLSVSWVMYRILLLTVIHFELM